MNRHILVRSITHTDIMTATILKYANLSTSKKKPRILLKPQNFIRPRYHLPFPVRNSSPQFMVKWGEANGALTFGRYVCHEVVGR